jgi:hypothetical protein
MREKKRGAEAAAADGLVGAAHLDLYIEGRDAATKKGT